MAKTILQRWRDHFGTAGADTDVAKARASSPGMDNENKFNDGLFAENLDDQSAINSASPIASGRSFGILAEMLEAVDEAGINTTLGLDDFGNVPIRGLDTAGESLDRGELNAKKASRVLTKILGQGNRLANSVNITRRFGPMGSRTVGGVEQRKETRQTYRVGNKTSEVEDWDSFTTAAGTNSVVDSEGNAEIGTINFISFNSEGELNT